MRLLPSTVKKLFSKIPSFSRSGRHSLAFLNVTQFLGVINDNVFKLVMSYLLIDSLGKGNASSILSATGAIYVLPFLFFSSSAGILADRFSKQKLLVIMKVAEMIVMTLAIFAFAHASVWGCYTLLFLLSTHSAMFGPSKYGIIPELVPEDTVSRANGLITSFTYLAIIIGTFLASFLTDITQRHFVYIAAFCLLIAIAGFFSSLGVKQTLPQDSEKRFNLFFVREIYETIKYTRSVRHLLTAIFGSAFFLLLGGFTQLNIIPFALQALNLSEIAGGYLFLSTALGIALGSVLAGRASRKRVELGMSCFAGFGIALFFMLMGVFSSHLYAVIVCLFMIGVLGGVFIVPFDTFIQLKSSYAKRGQTIAAANFLSFLGVLIASFAVYFFNELCNLSPAASFAVMGVITLIVVSILSGRLSDLFLPFLARRFFHPFIRFKRPDVKTLETASNSILVLEKATWRRALLLAGTLPSVHFFIPAGSRLYHWYHRFFKSIHLVPQHASLETLVTQVKEFETHDITPCLLLENTLSQKQPASNSFFDFFKRSSGQVLYVRFVEDPSGRTVRFEK